MDVPNRLATRRRVPLLRRRCSFARRVVAGLTSLAVAALTSLPVLPSVAAADDQPGTTIFLGKSFEKRPDGTTISYIYAGDLLVAAVIKPPTGPQRIQYVHHDHLGSTTLVTDEAGQVVARTEYAPYGATSQQQGASSVPHRFTGQRLDDSTGLHYYGARYYDSQLGRFIQPDPIVQAQADPQSLNRYSYVRNNPLRYTDPTGYGWFSNFFKKIGKAVVAAALAVATLVLAVAVPGGQPLAALTAKAFWVTAANTAFAASAATLTLDTGEGRQFQRHFANEVFDDALGFSPRAAAVASSVVSHAALTWGLEQLGAQMFLDPGKPAPTNKLAKDANAGAGRSLADLAQQGQGGTIRTLVNRVGQEFNYALVPKQGLFGIIPLDVFGPFKASLQPFQSANMIGLQHVTSSNQGLLFSGLAKAFHGTLKGLCVNEANLAAASMGLSWTASQAAGATYATYLSEMVFGTYGNQLSNAALNWIVANKNYHADQ